MPHRPDPAGRSGVEPQFLDLPRQRVAPPARAAARLRCAGPGSPPGPPRSAFSRTPAGRSRAGHRGPPPGSGAPSAAGGRSTGPGGSWSPPTAGVATGDGTGAVATGHRLHRDRGWGGHGHHGRGVGRRRDHGRRGPRGDGRAGRVHHFGRQVVLGDLAGGGHHRQPAADVFQLPHVAGPVVGHQPGERLRAGAPGVGLQFAPARARK